MLAPWIPSRYFLSIYFPVKHGRTVTELDPSKQEPPKIEFPCVYPIKVVGEAGDALRQHIIEVFTRHASDFDPSNMRVKDSSKGSFQSLTVTIEATGEPQLKAIFEDLKTNKIVKMVI